MADTVKERANTDGRDRKGRFTEGNQASKGRKPGASCRALRLAREAAEHVAIPVLVELCKKGNSRACEALLAAGVPKAKPVEMPEPLNLPKAKDRQTFLNGLLTMVRHGEISLDQAARAMELFDGVKPEESKEMDLPDIHIQFVDPRTPTKIEEIPLEGTVFDPSTKLKKISADETFGHYA